MVEVVLRRAPIRSGKIALTLGLALGLTLGCRGEGRELGNFEDEVGDNEVYVLEVNPRASRTVPFVSKCIGASLAKVAARCMAGQTLASQDFQKEIIHSYRHRYGLVASDPALVGIEQRLAAQPAITVPCLTFDGADDGVRPPAAAAAHAHRFAGPRRHTVVPGVGHNMPQEVPRLFADAVLEMTAPLR